MSFSGGGVRVDKWMWAARFFKTRALAAKACELGRVLINAKEAKAAREVKVGDALQVTNDGGVYVVEVLLLNEVRGPAAVAQTMFSESEAGKAARMKAAEDKKAFYAGEGAILRTPSRPSKKDRRLIHTFRGR